MDDRNGYVGSEHSGEQGEVVVVPDGFRAVGIAFRLGSVDLEGQAILATIGVYARQLFITEAGVAIRQLAFRSRSLSTSESGQSNATSQRAPRTGIGTLGLTVFEVHGYLSE